MELETATAWSVGITAYHKGLEVHAVNCDDEVVLEGWFPMQAGLAFISARPCSLIAVDAETISPKIASALLQCGDAVLFVPTMSDISNPPVRRRAKEIHDLGRSMLVVMN